MTDVEWWEMDDIIFVRGFRCRLVSLVMMADGSPSVHTVGLTIKVTRDGDDYELPEVILVEDSAIDLHNVLCTAIDAIDETNGTGDPNLN